MRTKMLIKRNHFIFSISIALILCYQIFFPTNVFADTKSTSITKTTPTTKNTTAKASSVNKAPTPHRASTTVATLHVYTKVSDLKSDSLIKHLLKAAVSADSPDNTPDGDDRSAALINLDVNETLVANLIRKDKFDLANLEEIDKNNIVLGSLTRDNVFHLQSGNALFAPRKDIIVLTDLAEIHIAAGSIVGVLKPQAGLVSVYDMEDEGKHKVFAKVDNDLISLSPGKHLVLSKEAADFDKITPARRIAHRKLEHQTLASGTHVYKTEFSISSAILHLKPLQNILLSDNKEDKKLADRLVKNFVILEDVFQDGGEYKMPATMIPPVKISSTNLN